MEETTEFAVHAGMFPTSMKVFRISGRDTVHGVGGGVVVNASMKVFRISGRDLMNLADHKLLAVASMKVFHISGRDRNRKLP